MPQYNKINVTIGGNHIMAETVNVNQSTPNTPLYAFNNARSIDTTINSVKSTIGIDYFPEVNNEPNLALISGWKNNTTGNLRTIINIGDSYIAAYLNSYSLEVLPNQLVKAKANYDCFSVFVTPFNNQYLSDTGLYNTTKNTGLFHYWNTKFLQGGGVVDNTDILQLSYNFNAEIKPNYSLGASPPCQVSAISAIENISVISESQPILEFNPLDFNDDFFGIESVRLSGFAGNNFIDIPLTGFISQTNSTNISEGQLILFNTEFNKYY